MIMHEVSVVKLESALSPQYGAEPRSRNCRARYVAISTSCMPPFGLAR